PDELADLGAERNRTVGDLWRRVFHHAFRALQATGAIAVAVTSASDRTARVVLASQRVRGFPLQAFLDDQSGRKAYQLGAQIAPLAIALDQCLQALARPLGCGYPVHRGAPLLEAGRQNRPRRFANQARLHPTPFSSKFRTSPPPRIRYAGQIRSVPQSPVVSEASQ